MCGFVLGSKSVLRDLPSRFWQSSVSYSASGSWVAAIVYRPRHTADGRLYAPARIEIWKTDKDRIPARAVATLTPDNETTGLIHDAKWIGDNLVYCYRQNADPDSSLTWVIWLSSQAKIVGLSCSAFTGNSVVVSSSVSNGTSVLLTKQWYEEASRTVWALRRFRISNTGALALDDVWTLPMQVVHIPATALSPDGRYLLVLAHRERKPGANSANRDRDNEHLSPIIGYYLLDTLQQNVISLPFPAQVDSDNRVTFLPNGFAACVTVDTETEPASVVSFLYHPPTRRLSQHRFTEVQLAASLRHAAVGGHQSTSVPLVIGHSSDGTDLLVLYRAQIFSFDMEHRSARQILSDVALCRFIQYLGKDKVLIQWNKLGDSVGFNVHPDVWRGPDVWGKGSRWGLLCLE
jgi:hypothetical protein